jgi:hypothetical protein
MGTLERAIAIAAEAHAGQLDKAGAPYITHPLRIMLAMTTPAERIVAVLHDVVEDCPAWTLERLRGEGFPDRIIAAVEAVTHRPGEDYETYVRRAAADPIGRHAGSLNTVRVRPSSARTIRSFHHRLEKLESVSGVNLPPFTISVVFVSPHSDQASEIDPEGRIWNREPSETQQQFIERVEDDLSAHGGVVIFWNPVRPAL